MGVTVANDLAQVQSYAPHAYGQGVAPADTAKYPIIGPKVKKLTVSAPAGATEQTLWANGGRWKLPQKALVQGVFIDVRTVAAQTLSIGTLSSESNGDADGFLVTAAVSTVTGPRWPTATEVGALLQSGTTPQTQETGRPETIAQATLLGGRTLSWTASAASAMVVDVYVVYFDLMVAATIPSP